MAVYVDNMMAPFKGMLMCHLLADSREELLAMVDKIGVDRKWIQHPGTTSEHFDIAKGKRDLAIKHGAIRISWRQAGMIQMERDGRLPESHAAEMAHLRSLWALGIDTDSRDEEQPQQKGLFD